MQPSQYTNIAFFSYKHEDEEWANTVRDERLFNHVKERGLTKVAYGMLYRLNSMNTDKLFL